MLWTSCKTVHIPASLSGAKDGAIRIHSRQVFAIAMPNADVFPERSQAVIACANERSCEQLDP